MLTDVIDRLKKIMVKELDVNLKEEEIKEDASFFEDGLGLDSIAIVDLICLIEDHFGFQFLDSELGVELFTSLNTLGSFISNKINSKEAESSAKAI